MSATNETNGGTRGTPTGGWLYGSRESIAPPPGGSASGPGSPDGDTCAYCELPIHPEDEAAALDNDEFDRPERPPLHGDCIDLWDAATLPPLAVLRRLIGW